MTPPTPPTPPVATGMLGSKAMTIVGMSLAFLQVVEISLPADAPAWIHMVTSGLTAAALAGLGYSHPGRAKKP